MLSECSLINHRVITRKWRGNYFIAEYCRSWAVH